MITKLEGIDRSHNPNKVELMKDRSDKRKLTDKESDLNKSLNENELSGDEFKKKLNEEIDDMNKITQTIEENLSFELHEDTDRLIVRVVDKKTDEVIKELPPEEMLDLAAKIHKMVGLLIDEKV